MFQVRDRLRLALAVTAFLGLLVLPAVVRAQTGQNVLVVVNEDSPASVELGAYYAGKRTVPAGNVVRIKTATTETVQRAEYERTIEGPIAAWLARFALQDKILYIVLTKGVPIRIAGLEGREATTSSVDSELTLLYRKMLGFTMPAAGRIPNPYFLGEQPVSSIKRFTRSIADTYLVTRLDGFTLDDAKALVDRSVAAAATGKFVLDKRATFLDRGGDAWLDQTADRLRLTGDRVILEESRALASASEPVAGYYSWGSNDPSNRLRALPFKFVDGAIGGMFVSTDGRTFVEPPADWLPGESRRPGGMYGSGSQSSAGDLVRSGLTGVSAHVSEPYLDATIRPQILFPAYVGGATLGEAFYLGMPFLSWQNIVLGDPLCAPYPRKPLEQSDLHNGIDPDTELPALFAERRIAVIGRTGLKPDAIKLLLKVEAQNAGGDRSNLIPLLERAVTIEPRLLPAQLLLASAYEEKKDYAKAVERYRAIVAQQPDQPAALNNLAYSLAERMNQPKEALPLAEKAYAIAPVPVIADTLGWIHHLLGNKEEALRLMKVAADGAPGLSDVQLHAAFVFAAAGDVVGARSALAAAEKLDATVAERADVKNLRDKIR